MHRKFAFFMVLLAACFGKPLLDLVRFALHSDLYSHILLVPFISLFLGWRCRGTLSMKRAHPTLAAVPFLLGLLALIGYAAAKRRGFDFVTDDYLAITMFAFVCFTLGGGLMFLGASAVRALAFPFGFLIFLAPFPAIVTQSIEVFFQHASAEAANVFFQASGTPTSRQGLIFRFPGLGIRVDQECSGIHSSLVLFLTSLLAGHLLLRDPWKRAGLALLVIPLAIARNAFRIFTLVMLTLHVNPNAIHSPIHTQGGPLFFLLSLIPFFLLVVWLRRRETRITS